MTNISPKAEPVGWSVTIGLIIAAVASYGVGVTPELQDAIVLIVPMLIAAWVARSNVSPKGKVDDAYRAGLDDAQAACVSPAAVHGSGQRKPPVV